MLAILSENRQSYLTSMEIFLYVISVNPAIRIHMQTQVQKFVLIKIAFVFDAFESPALSTKFLKLVLQARVLLYLSWYLQIQ